MSVLLLCSGDRAERRRSLTAISEELFSNGVNWGRIVALMEMGGALCTEVVRRGGAWQVDDITDWMEETLESPLLQDWIEANGSWVGGALRAFGFGSGFCRVPGKVLLEFQGSLKFFQDILTEVREPCMVPGVLQGSTLSVGGHFCRGFKGY